MKNDNISVDIANADKNTLFAARILSHGHLLAIVFLRKYVLYLSSIHETEIGSYKFNLLNPH